VVRIVTESTADIPASLAESLGIGVVPSYVVFGTETCRDGVDLSREEFYTKLVTSRVSPTTAAPPPDVYEQIYRQMAGDGEGIVSIHLAARFSGLYSSAAVAAQNMPGERIAVIDSGQVTMGYGWLAVAAAEQARRGDSLEQIVASVEKMKGRTRVLALLDTLEYLQRGGRVSWVGAMLGAVLQIKPLIEVAKGEVNLRKRARTFGRGLEQLLEAIRALGPLERCMVLHTNHPERGKRLAERLEAILPGWRPAIGQAGVTIASHAGPGAVGLACILAENPG